MSQVGADDKMRSYELVVVGWFEGTGVGIFEGTGVGIFEGLGIVVGEGVDGRLVGVLVAVGTEVAQSPSS